MVSIHNPLTALSGANDRGQASPLVGILIFGFLWVVFFLRFSVCFRFFLASIDIHDIQRFTIIT